MATKQHLPRTWFSENGFQQVPQTEYINCRILYAHESDLRFVNQYGKEVAIRFNQSLRDPKKHHGHGVPYLQIASNIARKCHILRAMAFYGERESFIDRKGKTYCGQCHHLNGDITDHRKDNILAWLSRPQHRIADTRQKVLRTVVPDGDLHLFTYQRLRELQDPRVTSDEKFQSELEALRQKGFHRDPRTTDEIMQYEMSHHMEI